VTVPAAGTRGDAPWSYRPWVRAVGVAILLYLFLVGVNGLGAGFRALGEGVLDSFFRATENPFVGLMVGILATTLVRSSRVRDVRRTGSVRFDQRRARREPPL
jgi:hypothetical protein